jgi:hypothetical protein
MVWPCEYNGWNKDTKKDAVDDAHDELARYWKTLTRKEKDGKK